MRGAGVMELGFRESSLVRSRDGRGHGSGDGSGDEGGWTQQ